LRQSKAEIYLHLVWTTLRREPWLVPEVSRAVYRCLTQEAERLGCDVLALGGTADHVHLAVKQPTRLAVARLMNQIKGVSSHFVHDQMPSLDGFAWQEGYGVFSIGRNQIAPVIEYIANQERHHAEGSTHARWEEADEEYTPQP
jgi:putative transposase